MIWLLFEGLLFSFVVHHLLLSPAHVTQTPVPTLIQGVRAAATLVRQPDSHRWPLSMTWLSVPYDAGTRPRS